MSECSNPDCPVGCTSPECFVGGMDEAEYRKFRATVSAVEPITFTVQTKPEPNPRRKPDDHPAIWDLVIADMRERDRDGERKYGTRLGPQDGRRTLVDAYQEALDLAVYLRKAIWEQEGR